MPETNNYSPETMFPKNSVLSLGKKYNFSVATMGMLALGKTK